LAKKPGDKDIDSPGVDDLALATSTFETESHEPGESWETRKTKASNPTCTLMFRAPRQSQGPGMKKNSSLSLLPPITSILAVHLWTSERKDLRLYPLVRSRSFLLYSFYVRKFQLYHEYLQSKPFHKLPIVCGNFGRYIA